MAVEEGELGEEEAMVEDASVREWKGMKRLLGRRWGLEKV
jgi:hypothetical protein